MMFRIVFWDILPCKMIFAPLKRRSTIILHGSISQKTTLNNKEEVIKRNQYSEIQDNCHKEKIINVGSVT
jgi:hypothetical protein